MLTYKYAYNQDVDLSLTRYRTDKEKSASLKVKQANLNDALSLYLRYMWRVHKKFVLEC